MKSKRGRGKLINPVFVSFRGEKKREKNMLDLRCIIIYIYIHSIWRYEIYFMTFHIRFHKDL